MHMPNEFAVFFVLQCKPALLSSIAMVSENRGTLCRRGGSLAVLGYLLAVLGSFFLGQLLCIRRNSSIALQLTSEYQNCRFTCRHFADPVLQVTIIETLGLDSFRICAREDTQVV